MSARLTGPFPKPGDRVRRPGGQSGEVVGAVDDPAHCGLIFVVRFWEPHTIRWRWEAIPQAEWETGRLIPGRRSEEER